MTRSRSTAGASFLPGLHSRLGRYWTRHGRTFWILHSIWALLTGALVLWLAHERYDFVYWVVGFLGLTWVSTLFFCRPRSSADGRAARSESGSPGFGRGLASYLTRVLYQETLFFLIPFYVYSAVVPSWNLAFVILLGTLAVLACLDLVFDRWLRSSATFCLVFFASVAFAAVNLLLPMLGSMHPAQATPTAAVAALATAAPLVWRSRIRGRREWIGICTATLAMLGIAFRIPQLIPPVPLRLQTLDFAVDIERSTLEPIEPIGASAERDSLDDRLVVVARVFAPVRVPARVGLDWYRDDVLVRRSREVDIVAHEGGFRLWDVLRAENGALEAGSYRVVLRTEGDREFGSARVSLR